MFQTLFQKEVLQLTKNLLLVDMEVLKNHRQHCFVSISELVILLLDVRKGIKTSVNSLSLQCKDRAVDPLPLYLYSRIYRLYNKFHHKG